MTSDSGTIAVVGGGPAGMAAAWRLVRAGIPVVVHEAEGWLGGRTRTDRQDGFSIDAGAQLFGSMFSRLFSLVREVGMEEDLIRTSGRDALWRDGRAHEVVYGSVASMLASGGLSWRTKMRLGTTYVPFLQRHTDVLDPHTPEMAAAAGLDRESIAEWGSRRLDKDFVEHLVYPQLSAYYGALPEETSAGLYHILAHQGIDVSVYALRRGAASLCEAIAEQIHGAGARVLPSTPVEGVEADDDGVSVVTAGDRQRYAGVVMATPAMVTASILHGANPDLIDWLRGVRYRPAVTLGLLLNQSVGARYFGISFAREAAQTVVAACIEENKVASLVPEGRGMLVAFARPDVAPRLVDADPQLILDAMIADLVLAFPGIDRMVERARLYRWRTGNPIFYPGYLQRLGEFRRGGVEGHGRVTVAGDYLYGASVEGAVTAGTLAAERMMRRIPT